MFLGILNIVGLWLIAYQDFKERAVLAILFPVMALFMGVRFLLHVGWNIYLLHAGLNVLMVLAILLVLYVYTRFIHRIQFLNKAIGLGDVWLFFVLALGFPTATFIVLFSCALLFSLMLSLFLRVQKNSIPLAGFMALFVSMALGLSLLDLFPNLYQY